MSLCLYDQSLVSITVYMRVFIILLHFRGTFWFSSQFIQKTYFVISISSTWGKCVFNAAGNVWWYVLCFWVCCFFFLMMSWCFFNLEKVIKQTKCFGHIWGKFYSSDVQYEHGMHFQFVLFLSVYLSVDRHTVEFAT